MKAQKILFILILFILVVTSGKGQTPAVTPPATPEVTPIGKDKPAAATQEVAPAKKVKSEKPSTKNQTGDIEALIEAAKVEAKKGWDAEMATKLKTLEDAKKTAETELAAIKNKAPEVDKKQSDADKKAVEEAQTVAKAAQTAASDAQKALNQKEIELSAKSSEVKTLQNRSDNLEQDLAKIKKVAKEKGNLEAAIADAEKRIGASKEQMKDIQTQKETAEKQAKLAEEQAKESGKKADIAEGQKKIAEGEKAIAEKKMMIAIGAGLLLTLLITVIGGSYYVKKLKQKSREIDEKNKELEVNNANLMLILGEKQALEASLEKMKTELANKKREQGNIQGVIEASKEKGKELGVIFPQLDNKNYFFAETMTSAGPRKSAEIGLGEDVTGMLVREDFACFWIFDGVSDNHILKNETGEYFSSRLLAQSIAWAMQTKLSGINHTQFDLKMALEGSCMMALESIQEKINKLSTTEKDHLLAAIRNRDIPTIATTALVGLLSKQGDLKIYRIGVDKWVALPQGKIVDPKKDGAITDRIAFSLDANRNGQLVVKAADINDHAHYVQSLENVTTVIGATDGVSNTLLNWLKAQKQLDFANPTVRKMIANNRDQTHDDKSLCIIQIKSIS